HYLVLQFPFLHRSKYIFRYLLLKLLLALHIFYIFLILILSFYSSSNTFFHSCSLKPVNMAFSVIRMGLFINIPSDDNSDNCSSNDNVCLFSFRFDSLYFIPLVLYSLFIDISYLFNHSFNSSLVGVSVMMFLSVNLI